jgi:hypothetical protein
MGKRARGVQQYYAQGDADHGPVKQALSSASRATRRNVGRAFGQEREYAITDTSHLMVSVDVACTGGGSFKFEFYDPVRLVQHVIDHSPALKTLYAEKLEERPGPWRIVLGFDEQTPGSKVNHDNKRKNMCVMFNFLELGADVLETDATWYIPVVLRPKLFKTVDGGWSCILKHFLRRMLLGPQSLTVAGVMVQVNLPVETCHNLQASISTCLTDGEGWMIALQWNGHASMRPCWRHANVFKKDGGMTDIALGYVDITCSDPLRLRRWAPVQWYRTIDAVLEARRKLDAGEAGWNKKRLLTLIKDAGFCPTASGLLADMELRRQVEFLSVCAYDWMHTAFQDGFMSNAMWLVVRAISTAKRGNQLCEDVVTHLAACQFPLSKTSFRYSLKHLFAPLMVKKHLKKRAIVGNASPQFTLYPILQDYALKEVEDTPALRPHVAVYVAACKIIDIIRLVKHRRLSTQDAKPRLLTAIGEWLDLHKVQYGTVFIRPKFFWMWAIAERIADTEWLFDMFYIERQHKRVKPNAELVKNLTSFERSVLFRVLDAQVCSLQGVDFDRQYSLLGTRRVRVATSGVVGLMADKCVSGGAELSCDDIVTDPRGIAAVILACILCDDGRLLLKVELMRSVGRSVWTSTQQQVLWLARDAQQPVAWRQREDGCIVVIV